MMSGQIDFSRAEMRRFGRAGDVSPPRFSAVLKTRGIHIPRSPNVSLLAARGITDATPAVTNAPAALNEPPAQAPDHTPSAEEDAPDFDPKLTLEWPGTPEESRRRINAGMADETTIYNATFSQTGPVPIFAATVHQFSEKDLQGADPKEMLASHGTSGDEIELTRKPIKHGPNKLLGLRRDSEGRRQLCPAHEHPSRHENLFRPSRQLQTRTIECRGCREVLRVIRGHGVTALWSHYRDIQEHLVRGLVACV